MAPRVKICGIKTAEDAKAAADAGAEIVGFHVGLTGGRSPLSLDEAQKLIEGLPSDIAGAIVTSSTDVQELMAMGRTGAAILQLYGEVTPSQILDVKKEIPAIEIWKVVNVSGEDAIAKAKEYEGSADALALDSAPKGAQKGGTGETHDWNISKKIKESVALPIVLAGGLNPENVPDAIRTVQPYAVDVNSGVSNPDGSKNIEKVKAFITVSNA